jgi:hypothetical protein
MEGTFGFLLGRKVKTPFALRQNVESASTAKNPAFADDFVPQLYSHLFNIDELFQII